MMGCFYCGADIGPDGKCSNPACCHSDRRTLRGARLQRQRRSQINNERCRWCGSADLVSSLAQDSGRGCRSGAMCADCGR